MGDKSCAFYPKAQLGALQLHRSKSTPQGAAGATQQRPPRRGNLIWRRGRRSQANFGGGACEREWIVDSKAPKEYTRGQFPSTFCQYSSRV